MRHQETEEMDKAMTRPKVTIDGNEGRERFSLQAKIKAAYATQEAAR